MKNNKTRKKGFCSVWSLVLLLLILCSTNSFALIPEFNSYGWLVFKAEDTIYGRTYTGFYSMACGVATWYKKYNYNIRNYTITYKSSTYYATLPYYGYTQVTAAKLASLIYYDTDLGLNYISQDVVDLMEDKLTDDRNSSTTYPKAITFRWDPVTTWKWRSTYMENRYSENSDTRPIHANCWGTADYLTRSTEWADAYPEEKEYASSLSWMDEWGASFPHIYLDGYMSGVTYSIDKDLYNHSWRFHLEGHGTYSLVITNYINSFDVIRMSEISSGGPFSTDLVFDGINLGLNYHCAAYLCTDMYGRYWFYEKGNYGSTENAPYKVRAFGIDPTYQYESCYRSLFRHDYDFKLNIASEYTENWAGITP